jgi:hypothetical protein
MENIKQIQFDKLINIKSYNWLLTYVEHFVCEKENIDSIFYMITAIEHFTWTTISWYNEKQLKKIDKAVNLSRSRESIEWIYIYLDSCSKFFTMCCTHIKVLDAKKDGKLRSSKKCRKEIFNRKKRMQKRNKKLFD